MSSKYGLIGNTLPLLASSCGATSSNSLFHVLSSMYGFIGITLLLLASSCGVTSSHSLFHVLSSSCDFTCWASVPGYQLNFLTMPSAWTWGLVAISTNFFATAMFAALAGIT